MAGRLVDWSLNIARLVLSPQLTDRDDFYEDLQLVSGFIVAREKFEALDFFTM